MQSDEWQQTYSALIARVKHNRAQLALWTRGKRMEDSPAATPSASPVAKLDLLQQQHQAQQPQQPQPQQQKGSTPRCDPNCADVQPPSQWAYPRCAGQLANGKCAERVSLADGYCKLTCGICVACGPAGGVWSTGPA